MTSMPRLLLLLMAIGCAGGDGSVSGGVVVRDSAGIEIVEHSAEAISALPVWGVVGEPLVDIGGGEDPNEQFSRVWGVVRLTDGRIMVHDNQANELRLFDAKGRFVRLVAGAGDGPGEIGGLGSMQWRTGDTIAVTESRRRMSLFTPEGHFARQVTYPQVSLDEAYLEVLAVQGEGQLLAMIQPMMRPPASMDEPVVRRQVPLVRLSADGSAIDTVTHVPGPPFYPVIGSEFGMTFPTWTFAIFSERSHVATDQELVVLGTNERNEIHVYRGTSLLRIIRNATPALPVTEAEVARFKALSLAQFGEHNYPEVIKRERREALESQRVASHFPFHDRISIARDGSIWVQDYRPVSTDPYRFLVYGEDGRAVARVDLPAGVRPWHLDRELIAGVWLDADDVPHVRVWRIGPV